MYNRSRSDHGVPILLAAREVRVRWVEKESDKPMFDYTEFVDTLKDKQDEMDQRRELLWPRFAAFRDGLLEGLVSFAAQAVDSGVRGVMLPKIERQSDDLVRAQLTLNGWDLVLIAPDAFLLDALALSIREEIAP
jgi:hypothetical protein